MEQNFFSSEKRWLALVFVMFSGQVLYNAEKRQIFERVLLSAQHLWGFKPSSCNFPRNLRKISSHSAQIYTSHSAQIYNMEENQPLNDCIFLCLLAFQNVRMSRRFGFSKIFITKF